MNDQTIEDLKVFIMGVFALGTVIIGVIAGMAWNRNRKQQAYWKWLNSSPKDQHSSGEDSFHD